MPTYQYQCKSCGADLEIFQKFSEASLTVCPTCQGELRKVFNAVGIVFKGSGFYKTDSRGGSSSIPAATSTDTTSKPKESTPAATPAPAPAKAAAPAASSAAPKAAAS